MSDMKRSGGGGFGAFRKIRRLQAAGVRGGPGQAEAAIEQVAPELVGPARRNQVRHRDLLARAGERERVREQEGIRRREEPAGREEQPAGQEEIGQDVALVVQGRGLDVSARVVKYSSLFTDLMQLAESDQTAIPVPDFISKQIMLDLVEIVEKDDTAECAHLVLVSLSYLLDFLIAVDFLGFQEIKATVETRVKEHINDSTWKDVFHYTKDIIGLFNTSRHAVEHVCRRLAEGQPAKPAPGGGSEPRPAGVSNQLALVEGRPEGRDPYREDYLDFPATFFRVMLKDKMLNPSFKLFLLKLWVQRHPDRKGDIFTLVSALPYKDYRPREVQEAAAGWGLGLEAMEEVAGMERGAKEEREKEAEERKEHEKHHKRLRRGHLLHPGMGLLFEFGGDFGVAGPAPPPGQDIMEDILLHF